MVLDESTLERMLASGKAGKEFQRPPAKLLDANDEFEVYERAAPQGVRETIRQEPAPDLEEYPPRGHAPAPLQPRPRPDPSGAPPAAPSDPRPQPEPVPEPDPDPLPAPAPSSQPPPPPPTTPPPAPAPPTAPHVPAHAEAEAPTYDHRPPQQQPQHGQPPRPTAHPPARPQVFSLQRPRPEPAPSPAAPKQGHGGPARIALVQADYNADITDLMAQWAIRHAEQRGAVVVAHLHVPGVFDVPLTTKLAARRSDVDAVVVVGAVVQGETGHDELIAREAARLLADIAYTLEKPVGLGIAGPRMTMEQAEARIKMGRNAVESVLRQLDVIKQVQG